MKKIVLVIGIFLLGAVLLFFIRPSESYENISHIDSSGDTIIVFGDSITKGFGVGEENAFPKLLEKELGVPIMNAGKSGDSTESALNRLDSDILSKNPRLVIVFLGGNDFRRRVPANTLKANLSQIIIKIQARNSMVMLVGIKTTILTEDYSEIYQSLSESFHTAYVPNILFGLLGREQYMHDFIHPNEEGHKVIAERILKVLKPLLKEAEKYR